MRHRFDRAPPAYLEEVLTEAEIKISDVLRKCLNSSVENGRPSTSHFFHQWFRGSGTPYFFLFRKNLRVTNLQAAELIALLKCHTKRTNGTLPHGLNFMSSDEFSEGFSRLVDSFSKAGTVDELIANLADYIHTLAANTIILDIYFGSALVLLPPGLKCEWAEVCARSGYIYACGPNLLFRNINKVTEELLTETFSTFVNNMPPAALPVRLVIYAHEDFTKHDRSKATDLINGLDDVKIFIEKYYVGSHRLVEVLARLEGRHPDRLHLMEPGPFQAMNEKVRDGCDPDRSLWLLVDHGVSNIARLKNDDQYLICYEQAYFNDNPLHIFDENKPAWIDHTTIPHTLMGAMLNITAPWWPEGRRPVIGDPFVGTGTTWFEAVKCGVDVKCSDLLSIADLLCSDNARFLSLTIPDLRNLSKHIEEAENVSMSSFFVPQLPGHKATKPYLAKGWLMDTLKHLPKQLSGNILNQKVIDRLRKEDDMLHRMLFYIALRTRRRHTASFIRLAENWEDAYKAESSGLRRQIEDLILTYERMSRRKPSPPNVIIFPGTYSSGVCLPFIDRLSTKGQAPVRSSVDVRKFQKKSCDVIVTDPPYGFNTDMPPADLAKLLQDTIGVVLDALKDNGQLVIALPDWSHTGRELPFFVLKAMFTQQVISAACERDMEVIGGNYGVPPPVWLFRPPYYWESARALRRAILHFRFRRVK